jgi:predicted GTPase
MGSAMERKRVVIMGAAGRDFHNFNMYFRENASYLVVGFTATQIPNIEGRVYPKELAGSGYPDGIPIYAESELTSLIKDNGIHQVFFSYSDVSHRYVMHKASIAQAGGADFVLLGPAATMLKSSKPVVAVCAVRTGSGKSQTTRAVVRALNDMGRRVVVVRHPMPYGDLVKQAVQRFETRSDLEKHQVTIEEREEYEPHLARGTVVYAGVDYEKILRAAEAEADVVLWDGGNNDFPFFKPDMHITVVDPHRPGHEVDYYPGETNLRMADVIVINKIDTAAPENVETVRANIRRNNPGAIVVDAASPIFVQDPTAILGKKVLIVEDGPTLTHGGMAYGAGVVAARRFGAAEIVDPRPYAVGSIKETYARYPDTGPVLPAMGYDQQQTRDMEATINRAPVDLVLIATPIDLRRIVDIQHNSDRVRYELQELGQPTLAEVLENKFGSRASRSSA